MQAGCGMRQARLREELNQALISPPTTLWQPWISNKYINKSVLAFLVSSKYYFFLSKYLYLRIHRLK